jgi:hypothetical protein
VHFLVSLNLLGMGEPASLPFSTLAESEHLPYKLCLRDALSNLLLLTNFANIIGGFGEIFENPNGLLHTA